MKSTFIFLLFHVVMVSAAGKYIPEIGDPLSESWQWTYFPELSGKSICCITESKDGAMWFGADSGVIRFDGLNWDFFNFGKKQEKSRPASSAPHSINYQTITICTTDDGSVYAGTSRNIYLLQDGRWQRLPLPLTFNFTLNPEYESLADYSIIQTSDGSIWIGSMQGALQIKNGQWRLFTGSQILLLQPDTSQAKLQVDFPVFNIYEDHNQTIWFGMLQGDIIKTDIKNGISADSRNWRIITKEDGLIEGVLPKVFQTRDSKIWIINETSGDLGLNSFDGTKWHHLTQKEFGGVFINHSFLETEDGVIWVGCYGKLHIFRKNNWLVYQAPEFPVPSNHLCLYRAKNGAVWMAGLRNDVVRISYETRRWTTFRGLNFQCESPEGQQWLLAADGQVVVRKPIADEWWMYDVRDGLIDAPTKVFITRNGQVGVSGSHQQQAAVAFFDGKSWYREIHPTLSWGIDYRSVMETMDGALWFGANEIQQPEHFGGALKYQLIADSLKYRFIRQVKPPTFPRQVQQLCQTDDGQIWLGSYDLYQIEVDQVVPVMEMREFTRQNTHFLYVAQNGNMWVSCRGYGVLKYDGRQWFHYSTLNGLSGNSIYSFTETPSGAILVNTENGINLFDGKIWTSSLSPATLKAGRVDGCLLYYSPRTRRLWINNSSRDWLMRARPGAVIENKLFQDYYTISYQPDTLAPQTRLISDVTQVSWEGNVTFIWQGTDPWYATPSSELVYSYRMNGESWSEFKKETYHTFFSLASGRYVLEVRTRDQDLNIEPLPARIEFYVVPPVWKTGWFYLVIFLVIGAVLTYFFSILKQKNLDELKIKIFTNISHEIRTPLTLIITPLEEVLTWDSLNTKITGALNVMRRNTLRLQVLIDQLLDFSKLTAGYARLDITSGDIVRFIQNIKDNFQKLADNHQINYLLSASDPSIIAWFDRDKIEKVISNLLSNAFKYTPERGKIAISLNLQFRTIPFAPSHRLYPDHSVFIWMYLKIKNAALTFLYFIRHKKISFRFIQIKIADSGAGILNENLPKIFKRFYDDKHLKSTSKQGWHIGLAYTRELVQLHYGEIYVHSQPGEGTTFTVLFPIDEIFYLGGPEVKKMDAVLPVPLKEPGEEPTGFRDPISVKNIPPLHDEKAKQPILLIIEDEIDMQNLLGGILETEYQLVFAGNGREGLKKAIQMIPDIIISDVMMSEMDGIELVRDLKNDRLTCHIPVILLTARYGFSHKMEGLEGGADEYLVKPFNPGELKIRLRNLLESRKILREKYSTEFSLKPKTSSIKFTDLDAQFIKRLKKIVEENMADENFDYNVLIKQLGISRRQLFRKIKALTNFTCNELIREMRLLKAQELLINSQLTITEIAYEVGFKEYSYFERCFKERFGKTPKSFRTHK